MKIKKIKYSKNLRLLMNREKTLIEHALSINNTISPKKATKINSRLINLHIQIKTLKP